MTFYETVAFVMNRDGLSAKDVCQKAGLHASYISKLKSGHTKDVTWEKAIAIITALGLKPSEFRDIQISDEVGLTDGE